MGGKRGHQGGAIGAVDQWGLASRAGVTRRRLTGPDWTGLGWPDRVGQLRYLKGASARAGAPFLDLWLSVDAAVWGGNSARSSGLFMA